MSIFILIVKILFVWTVISIPCGVLIGYVIGRNRPAHLRDEELACSNAAYLEMLRRTHN